MNRDRVSAVDQAAAFVEAADRLDGTFEHDMLHAAARVVEVMPRYAHSGEIEYIARWLDAAWDRYVAPAWPVAVATASPAAQQHA